MGLRAYILKRIIYSFILILFVLLLNFIIFEVMPADPTALFASSVRLGGVEAAQEMEKLWGFDQPMYIRLVKYMQNMLTGLFFWLDPILGTEFHKNFGRSYFSMDYVSIGVENRILNTFLLVGVSTIFSIIIGIVLGVIAAYKRGSILDSSLVLSSLTTYSVPSFWLGMMLLLIFHYQLGWFPSGQTTSFSPGNPAPNTFVYITDRLWHLFLPALTLTLFMYGGYLLLTRATILETLTEDYIMTARAKGLKERTILFKHALKNASLPLITNAAISIGFILSGAIITEQVFNYPGLGMWIWNAIDNADYPVMQCIFFLVAISVIAANFIADLLYGVIDPRIKYR